MKPIAIVGMGCRFGDAPDLFSFWEMSLKGRHAFKEPPPDRWDHSLFHDTNPRATDRSYAPTGAWIDDIRTFPALTLCIPPRRVEVMDPQQRFAIEVALQAIVDSGNEPANMPHRTGVFMGVTATEYRTLVASRITAQLMIAGEFGTPPEDPEIIARAVENVVPSRPFSAPGGLGNMIAAAVAQELDLHGPAYTLDAACASAFMAIYDAVGQLRAGTIDAAVAGGVYICVSPEHHVAFSRIGAISASGVCRPFDDEADGFVQGDGAAAVVLKRLEDAERDGDRIYATISGVAINNDGRGDGPMAPVASGQAEVIGQAWADAGLEPTYLGYLEAHGTGTTVGDVAEFDGLNQALGKKANDVILGSSKANIGHTMSAAAAAGLVRATLAVYHGTIPPMANFNQYRKEIPFEGSPFRVNKRSERWLSPTRLAAVSSFGFGGTNGHLVLTQAPAPQRKVALQQRELILLSAPDIERLRDLAGRTADAIESSPYSSISAIARACNLRPPLPARLGVTAISIPELLEKLRAFAKEEKSKGLRFGVAKKGTPKIAFLYPGQGSQRVGMLHAIRDRFPIVAKTLDDMDSHLANVLEIPVTHLLYPERREQPVNEETATKELTDTKNCQPALLTCGIALTELLKSIGVAPHVVTGHSLGEFTAAAVGEVLSPADAARYVALRGQAMADLEGDHGAMAAIMANADKTEDLLVHGAVLANLNHPRQAVVSGFTDAVA
ncbi:MAG: type I polyketide synthase, partial [Proteobacteria bacterium]|nr:type I polyketide synthase [Pseudomonadota bacterium]